MTASVAPATAEDLAAALREAVIRNRRIELTGSGSKRAMGGPIAPADVVVSTSSLGRVLAYEPNDLTISVEAGLRWRELCALLAEHRQMIPLDPPFADRATVGGVIAANTAGPRQRLYGTARDLVIGMTFATVEGKLVKSGGMVVKNVAGLDMAKLMIGSFGTLAAIVSVNFKLIPLSECDSTFVFEFETLSAAMAARNGILRSQLMPSALDLINVRAAAIPGEQWLLAVRVAGTEAALARYRRDLTAQGATEADSSFWNSVEEFTPHFIEHTPAGAVARASCTLKGLEHALASLEGPAIARAGSGACYGYFAHAAAAQDWAGESAAQGRAAVIEYSPEAGRGSLDLWPLPGSGFETMRRIKHLFDPHNLLNPGRLYGRI
jgi:glycolate oxidase FAD binding subunit